MEEIQIKIKMTSNAQVYTVKISKSDTILKLKEECEKQTQIPPLSQNLVYKGRILVNEKLVSDYNIENDHTIILVKKHSAPPPKTESKPVSSSNTSEQSSSNNQASSNNSNPNTNTNPNTNNNTNNNAGNNSNPFLGGLGGLGGMGGMPDLSNLGSILGNIDPNEINNMMQNMGGIGGLGGLGGMGGVNPQMVQQMLSNPMYLQMMSNMMQNPETLQMIMNSPQIRQLTQNNPQMQQILNNPQLMQQLFNPQTLQMMSSLFQGMGNTNNQQNPFGGVDFSQLGQMISNLGGEPGFGGMNNNTGSANNAGNSNNNNNQQNIDYKGKYKDQLAQLKDMGFINEETNIQVLKQTDGNVQFAIERLLNMLG